MSEQARSQQQRQYRGGIQVCLLLSTCLVLSCQGFSSQSSSPGPRLLSRSVRRSFQDDRSALTDEDAAIPDDVPDNLPPNQMEDVMKKQSLYELLSASKDDTRTEIKKKYLLLAKSSHPDAIIGRNGTDMDGKAPDFGEISQAWRVLGDPKTRLRYDRSLQAAQFSERVERMANERLERAVPVVANLLDKVAVPFLRRTTATTIAVAQAATKGFNKENNNNDPSGKKDTGFQAFFDVFAAGQRAGKIVDGLELTEKCAELEARADEGRERAKGVQQELSRVTEQRLFATLTSSDFALSSEEARQVLSKLDPKELQASEPSMLDRAMNKKSIAEEIDSLADLEASFTDKLILYEETDSQWNSLLSQRDSAKMTVSTSKIAEIEARKSLERAQRMVAEAKEHLVTTSKALRAVEQQVRKNALEMDTVTTQLTRNQERVRTALKKKTEMGMDTPNLTEADLAVLRQKEVKLLGESAQIELMVARLSSRAEKLKMRGIALERWEQNGRPDLNGANNGSTTASSQTTEEDQLKSYL